MAPACSTRQTAVLMAAGKSIIWYMDVFSNYCWLHENSGCLDTRYLGVYCIYLCVFDRHYDELLFVIGHYVHILIILGSGILDQSLF
jgi:hypothetical protein